MSSATRRQVAPEHRLGCLTSPLKNRSNLAGGTSRRPGAVVALVLQRAPSVRAATLLTMVGWRSMPSTKGLEIQLLLRRTSAARPLHLSRAAAGRPAAARTLQLTVRGRARASPTASAKAAWALAPKTPSRRRRGFSFFVCPQRAWATQQHSESLGAARRSARARAPANIRPASSEPLPGVFEILHALDAPKRAMESGWQQGWRLALPTKSPLPCEQCVCVERRRARPYTTCRRWYIISVLRCAGATLEQARHRCAALRSC